MNQGTLNKKKIRKEQSDGIAKNERQHSLVTLNKKIIRTNRLLRYSSDYTDLEQVTRVELAGNSLGSCRHTARRHLLILAPKKVFSLTLFIIPVFPLNVNGFLSVLSIYFRLNSLCTLRTFRKTPLSTPLFQNLKGSP